MKIITVLLFKNKHPVFKINLWEMLWKYKYFKQKYFKHLNILVYSLQTSYLI